MDDEVELISAWAKNFAMDPKAAKGIWSKVSGNEHPHAACVEMMKGKVDDPHAFCAAVEKQAAGTTPAERAAKKHAESEAHVLRGVEIFGPGEHNGDPYTEQDIDDIISAYGELDFKPPLKSGHSKDTPGMPALGWIGNLRKEGGKLVADFVDMPKIVYEYIKDKRFNAVSSEIYWNLKRGAKTFRRALKAVALLGADIPAVAGLRPLHELFSTDAEVKLASAVRLLSAEPLGKEIDMTEEELKALQDRAEKAEADAKAEKEKREQAEAQLAEAQKSRQPKKKDDLTDTADRISINEALEQAREFQARAEKAEAAAKADREARKRAEEEAQERAERVKKLEEAERVSRIGRLAETCKIPAVRPFITQFMDLATRNGEVTKVFAEGATGDEISATKAVEQFVQYVNQNAARIFVAVSRSDNHHDSKSVADAGSEVDRRVKMYMRENKVTDYTKALNAVLDEDPALKQEYVLRQSA